MLLGWTTGQDPDVYDIWHSSKSKPGELNFIHYHNPEVDRLLEEGRHTFDLAKRKAAYFRFQEILAEDQPYTFLVCAGFLAGVSSRVHGINPAPAGISYNFNKWYVPLGSRNMIFFKLDALLSLIISIRNYQANIRRNFVPSKR